MLVNGALSIELLKEDMRVRHHNRYRHSVSVPTVAKGVRLPLVLHFQVTAISYILRFPKYTHTFIVHCSVFVL